MSTHDSNHKRKNPDSSPASYYQGEELPGLYCKDTTFRGHSQGFYEKILSPDRLSPYYHLYPTNPEGAILHYQYNLALSESMYTSLSIFEVALRNALSRELRKMTSRDDWYTVFPSIPGLRPLNKYITQAIRHITSRHENVTPSKVIAELTLGFWVSLLNSEFERVLWKDLRRAFPFMPKQLRQRKNVAAPLNRIRTLRNRVFHNEPICWHMPRVIALHDEMVEVLGWIDKDIPAWLAMMDRFPIVSADICKKLGWK